MTTYPFRAGIDYGLRQGTLGLALHMSEGGDELVNYLAKRSSETNAQWRTRIRGVSANACILSDGTVWNMVPWSHASGSMNPADRNPATTGYYNGTVIKAVLGSHYGDPNAWSISAEIAGRRATGPTPAQVKAVIAWGLDMRSRYPTLKGAYGHHDQTDTKGCPGTTAAMKAIFTGIGGHGLFTSTPTEDDMPELTTSLPGYQATSKPGSNIRLKPSLTGYIRRVLTAPETAVGIGWVKGDVDPEGGSDQWWCWWDGNKWAYSARSNIIFGPTPPVVVTPPQDCTDEVKAAVAADRAGAKIVWSEI